MTDTSARILILVDGAHKLYPPTGRAFARMADDGLDYLKPQYPVQVPVLDDDKDSPTFGQQKMGEDGPLLETRYAVVPPDMPRLRSSAIMAAAMLTQAEGLDELGRPVRVWTQEEVLDLMPVAPDELAKVEAVLSALIADAMPKPSEKPKRPPRRRPAK